MKLIHATLEIYRTRGAKRLQWRLIAGNGERIARSSQARGFTRITDLWANVRLTAMSLTATYGGLLPKDPPREQETIIETGSMRLTIRRAA